MTDKAEFDDHLNKIGISGHYINPESEGHEYTQYRERMILSQGTVSLTWRCQFPHWPSNQFIMAVTEGYQPNLFYRIMHRIFLGVIWTKVSK